MSDHNELCSKCATALIEARFNRTTSHEFQVVEVFNLERLDCPRCGSQFITAQQARRNQLKITDAERSASGLLTGEEIRRIRENLQLTQQEAGEMIGGGPMAFSKYERGIVAQSKAMDNFLRVLGRYPQVLSVLGRDSEGWTDIEPLMASHRRHANGFSTLAPTHARNDEWYVEAEVA